jgi:hypothetical protein
VPGRTAPRPHHPARPCVTPSERPLVATHHLLAAHPP